LNRWVSPCVQPWSPWTKCCLWHSVIIIIIIIIRGQVRWRGVTFGYLFYWLVLVIYVWNVITQKLTEGVIRAGWFVILRLFLRRTRLNVFSGLGWIVNTAATLQYHESWSVERLDIINQWKYHVAIELLHIWLSVEQCFVTTLSNLKLFTLLYLCLGLIWYRVKPKVTAGWGTHVCCRQDWAYQ